MNEALFPRRAMTLAPDGDMGWGPSRTTPNHTVDLARHRCSPAPPAFSAAPPAPRPIAGISLKNSMGERCDVVAGGARRGGEGSIVVLLGPVKTLASAQ